MKTSDKLYKEMKQFAKELMSLRNKGYILLLDNKVINDDIVFTSPFADDCIKFKWGNAYSGISKNRTDYYGSRTILQEYQKFYRDYLKSIKIIDPKHVTKASDIIKL